MVQRITRGISLKYVGIGLGGESRKKHLLSSKLPISTYKGQGVYRSVNFACMLCECLPSCSKDDIMITPKMFAEWPNIREDVMRRGLNLGTTFFEHSSILFCSELNQCFKKSFSRQLATCFIGKDRSLRRFISKVIVVRLPWQN